MIVFKINGFDIYKSFGIVLSGDKTTTSSFEIMNDIKEPFSHDWADGVTEYDLNSPTVLSPRIFTLKGTLIAANSDEYKLTKMAIASVLQTNYFTIEIPIIEVEVNAKIKSGNLQWGRITNISGGNKIAVNILFKFDEIMQDVPFIDNGSEIITYLVDNQERFYNTQTNKFIIT